MASPMCWYTQPWTQVYVVCENESPSHQHALMVPSPPGGLLSSHNAVALNPQQPGWLTAQFTYVIAHRRMLDAVQQVIFGQAREAIESMKWLRQAGTVNGVNLLHDFETFVCRYFFDAYPRDIPDVDGAVKTSKWYMARRLKRLFAYSLLPEPLQDSLPAMYNQ
jgi:hypothetical protein